MNIRFYSSYDFKITIKSHFWRENTISLPLVGRVCNNFEKNRAFYDKSTKLGTWLVDNNTN